MLTKHGITRQAAKNALEIGRHEGRFTVWAIVDALTRVAGEYEFAGDRTESDQTASGLLQLVS